MTKIRYHLFGATFESSEEAQQSVSRALQSTGFAAVTSLTASTSYLMSSGPPVQVDLEARKDITEVLVSGLSEKVFEQYGADLIREALIAVSESLEGHVGRTYGESALTAVHPSELTGAVDALDWFQYFGPDIAVTMLPNLENAPVWQWGTTARGSVWLTLAATPFDDMMSIRRAADALGISLRPIRSKDMNGRPIELNWR